MRPVEVGNIAPRFLGSFEASVYTDDNPSARTPTLHRPGIVRTDQRLGDYFRDAEILQRSRYYHEWLQPQDFTHTMGVTPLAEDGIRSEEHTSELQSLMRISYAVFCLKKKKHIKKKQ